MEAIKEFNQQCGNCGSSSFSCWCLDCNEALCDVCLSAHRRVTVTRSHQIFNQPPSGDISTPPIKFCRLHPSEPIKLYCFTCNQLTCRDCQLTDHMNHRYQFLKEALDSMKGQLEAKLQPIRAQGDKVSRSLQDMKTRLKDIIGNNTKLGSELQQSYILLTQHLKTRMDNILKQVQSVCLEEYELVQRRIIQMEKLQKNQQLATEIVNKSRKTNDLSDLRTYIAQVESQLNNLPDWDLSAPQTMAELKVITDQKSLETLLNFGSLKVSWVPFCISQTSCKNSPATSSSTPPSPAAPPPTPPHSLPHQIWNGFAIPVSSSSTSSLPSPLCLSSFSTITPTTSTCLAPSRGAAPQTGTTQRSTPRKPFSNQFTHPSFSSPSINQSNAPFTSPQTVQHFPTSVNPQPVGFHSPASAHLSPVVNLVQPLVFNSPSAPHQNQSATVRLPNPNNLYQVSSIIPPSVMPQFTETLLSSTSPGNTCSDQQKSLMGKMIPGQFNPASVSCRLPLPSATTANPLKDLSFPTTSSPQSSDQHPTPDINPHSSSSSSLKDQRQSPVVKAVADSACDRSIERVATRRKEPEENEPTSTMSEETAPAREPYAPGVLDGEAEELDPAPIVAELLVPEVAEELDPAPEVAELLVPEVAEELDPAPKVAELLVPEVAEELVPEVAEELDPAPKVAELLVPEVAEELDPPPEVAELLVPEVAEELDPPPKVAELLVPEVAEEPETASEVLDTEAGEQSSVIGHLDCSQSQWQPRVSLFRLPVSLSLPGCPFPCFRLVPGDAEDEIYLKEISEDTQSRADDVTNDIISELPSSVESPLTLVTITCSACQSDNSSIVCSFCSRGYHRDCHVPPVGPKILSEWICSLCQDLSDPSDPFSSDRPPRPQHPGLSLQDQRRCESLLLYLKVEGWTRLPQCQLTLMSERLSVCRSSYQTAAEFLSDVSCLFKDALQGDGVVNRLQERAWSRWMGSLTSELMSAKGSITEGGEPAVTQPFKTWDIERQVAESLQGSKFKSKERKSDVTRESQLKETRKRLRKLRNLMEASPSKRMKKDKMENKNPHL